MDIFNFWTFAVIFIQHQLPNLAMASWRSVSTSFSWRNPGFASAPASSHTHAHLFPESFLNISRIIHITNTHTNTNKNIQTHTHTHTHTQSHRRHAATAKRRQRDKTIMWSVFELRMQDMLQRNVNLYLYSFGTLSTLSLTLSYVDTRESSVCVCVYMWDKTKAVEREGKKREMETLERKFFFYKKNKLFST